MHCLLVATEYMKITISALVVIGISQKSRCKLFFRTECTLLEIQSLESLVVEAEF